MRPLAPSPMEHGMAEEPLILGIETSCDETGVGLVRGRTLLADTVATSVAEHARFGGVVPEIATDESVPVLIPPALRTNPVTSEAGRTGAEPVSVKVTVSVVPAETTRCALTTRLMSSPALYEEGSTTS